MEGEGWEGEGEGEGWEGEGEGWRVRGGRVWVRDGVGG